MDLLLYAEIPARPLLPTAQSVNSAKLNISELVGDEIKIYSLLMTNYKEEKNIAKRVHNEIQMVNIHIANTMSKENLKFIINSTSVKEHLKILKKQLASTN